MKRKLTHVVIATALAATLISAAPATSYANPITNYTAQIEDLEDKILTYDNKIIEAIVKIEELTKDIEGAQQKISNNQQQIEEAQVKFDSLKEIYFDRLRAIQQNGQSPMLTYIDVILSSNGFGDLIERVTLISQVIEQDQKLLENLEKAERELNALQENLEKEQEQLEKNKQTVIEEQASLEENKRSVMHQLEEVKELKRQEEIRIAEEAARRAEEEARLAAEQAEQARQAQEAQQANQTEQVSQTNQSISSQPTVTNTNTAQAPVPTNTATNNNTTSNNTTSSPAQPVSSGNSDKATALINYSKQFLGTPYVWGGTTPSGFDCSGFTSYVFRSVGVNLPRTSRQQATVGVAVSPHQVQPGDLIFRGNPIHHVGIYIGNGQYIHSPQTGDVVKISSYNPSRHTQARRVLN
ncbi:C40 family peptidase [Alkalihalobacterium chitinilyticum]|uniref:NlpC/P60 family protein n=1 Tax=Alkalihalobacterium chitinilyticum TaxID=2980103 RepID=A0ABT5VKH0_9BACI|nr:C40 family peptidase [Alkalihalobacterium chitinilyticum]MDE5415958.1 NlpC/P60 family protein [Alkalihalobacterium chitinilyticum]